MTNTGIECIHDDGGYMMVPAAYKNKEGKANIFSYASYNYLREMQKVCLQQADDIQNKHLKSLREFFVKLELDNEYDPEKDYQPLYAKFQKLAEKIPFPLEGVNEQESDFYKKFFIALYENDNAANNNVFEWLKDYKKEQSDKAAVEHTSIKTTQENLTGFKQILSNNFGLFTHPERKFDKFFNGVRGWNYDPQSKSNVPYKLQIGVSNDRKCLRMGTQIHSFITGPKVNKRFLHYLKAKKLENPQHKHVYINLMKHDKGNFFSTSFSAFERNAERKRTLVLQKKIAASGGICITLPADGGEFFFKNLQHDKYRAKNPTKKELLQKIIDEVVNGIENNTQDFFFSKEAKQKIFGSDLKATVTALMNKAANEVGVGKLQAGLTAQQRQALLFHFVKSTLTDQILTATGATSYNISCKDAIDRGGVHSLWYHFTTNPGVFKREDFEREIDAAPLLVKERGMNEHRNALWNVLDHYYKQHKNDPTKCPTWVEGWLKDNHPNPHLQIKTKVLLEPPAPRPQLVVKETQSASGGFFSSSLFEKPMPNPKTSSKPGIGS